MKKIPRRERGIYTRAQTHERLDITRWKMPFDVACQIPHPFIVSHRSRSAVRRMKSI